jgi:hypothetical protein
MKKFFLFAAAMFAAVSINAAVIEIDLSKGIANDATLSLSEGVLTASYDLDSWGAGGVVFALDDLDVTELAFDYKSDGLIESWVSFIVYLEDAEGGQWYSDAEDLSISSWDAEWANKNYMPSDVLWDSSTATEPVKPFKALGFLANPENPTAGSFSIRNVKLTVSGEQGVENVKTNAKAVKVIRDGQMLIIREGKTFNALGAEMK